MSIPESIAVDRIGEGRFMRVQTRRWKYGEQELARDLEKVSAKLHAAEVKMSEIIGDLADELRRTSEAESLLQQMVSGEPIHPCSVLAALRGQCVEDVASAETLAALFGRRVA